MQPPTPMQAPERMTMNQYGDLQSIFGGQSFDPQAVEPQGDFDVLPPCKPPCQIDKAEVKQNKNGNGHYLKLEMTVLDGPHKNRKLFDQINIDNPNQQCVEIGLRTLSALGRAAGTGPISDTSQLIGKIVVPTVIVREDKIYGKQNAIRTYKSPNESQPQSGDAGLPAPGAVPFTQYTVPTPVAASQVAGPTAASTVGPAAAEEKPQPPWARKAA